MADEASTEVELLLKTLGRWSSHLLGLSAGGLVETASDGRQLMRLVEVLSGESIGKACAGQSTYHKLENINRCLQYLNRMGALSSSVRPESILNAEPLAITQLVWDIVNHYLIHTIQLKDVMNEYGQPLTLTSRNPLLVWCQLSTAGCPGVQINNFTSSWSDGHALTALIRRHCPAKDTEANDPAHRLSRALQSAQLQLGVPMLIDAQDVIGDTNRKCLLTYLSVFYHTLRHHRMSSPEVTRIQITQRDEPETTHVQAPAPHPVEKEVTPARQRLLPEAKFISDFMTVKRLSKGRRDGSIVHRTTEDILQGQLQTQTPIIHSDSNGPASEPLLTEPKPSFSTRLTSTESFSNELKSNESFATEPNLSEPTTTNLPLFQSFSTHQKSTDSFSTDLESIQSFSTEPNLTEPLVFEPIITRTTLQKPLSTIPSLSEPLSLSSESSTLTKMDVLYLLERMNRLESVVNRLEKDNQQLRDRLETSLDSLDELVVETQDEKRRLQRSVQTLIVTSQELQHRINQLNDSNHVPIKSTID